MAARTIGRKDFSYSKAIGTDIPIGFGANFNEDPICRRNLRKSHTLGEGDVEHPDDREDLSRFPPQAQYDTRAAMVTSSQMYGTGSSGAHLQTRTGMAGSMGGAASATGGSTAPPKVVDETVLRFLGYYMESVPESPDEHTRVHKVALLFHCADGSILLREASQVNSGLPQGVILKRQPVPRADGSGNISIEDLDVGATVTVFGKVLTLIDCSSATRQYLVDVAGRDGVADPLSWPSDDTYNATVKTKLVTKPKRGLPTTDFDHKRALEAMRGSGVISKHAPDDVRTAQQFLRNRINEHLQFAAYWDDRARMSGDLRLVVIKYYLENDSLEIVEARDENAGREGGNKLLCRQRVAHPNAPTPPPGTVQQNTFGLLVKSQYLTFDDLAVGIELRVAGNKYFLYDASPFTREWYLGNRQVELKAAIDISDVVQRGQKRTVVHYPPPHNGWGAEEDSLRSCKSLLLKPAPMDTAKAKREAGKVMVFRAVFERLQQPEDAGREFVVCFYRATDEVEVTERQLRNSGIVGGKFLAKGRHLKTLPDGRRVAYESADFTVGGVVSIAGRAFRLEQIDERSRRMLEGEVGEVSEDRIKTLIVALRELLNAKFYRAHEAYRAIAPEGTLTAQQLSEFFARSAGDITDEEAVHLVQYFSNGDGTGRISYDRFRKIMDPGNTTNLDEAANNPRCIKGVHVASRESAEGREQAEALQRTCDAAADEAAGRRLHRTVAAKLVQRRGTVQESFRMLAGHAPNARLAHDTFIKSLEEVLRLSLNEREQRLLAGIMFNTDDKRRRGLDFKAFSEFVEAV